MTPSTHVAHPAFASRSADLQRTHEYACFQLRPPYETPEFFSYWDRRKPIAVAPGGVVGLRVSSLDPDWSGLEQAVSQLRACAPLAPVVLLLRLPADECLLVSAFAARLHVRAVLLEGQPIRDTLRRSLTRTAGMGEEVVDWLTSAGVRLSPFTLSLAGRIVTLAPQHTELRGVLRAAGVPESTARFQFHKRLLPPPSRWFHLGRALHAAMRIQSVPDHSLLRIAVEQGYSDHSALCHQLQRAFRVRPGALRRLLGWEWLLDRWLAAFVSSACRRLPVTAAPGGVRS